MGQVHAARLTQVGVDVKHLGQIRRRSAGLPDGALSPDYAGIRPKLHGPGEPQPDFRLDGPDTHGLPGLMALFGIESPGLTSSMAIGDAVTEALTTAG